MKKNILYLLVCLLPAGCASFDNGSRATLQRVSEDTHLLETRMTGIEERLTLVEQEIGVLHSQGVLPQGARWVDPAPSLAKLQPQRGASSPGPVSSGQLSDVSGMPEIPEGQKTDPSNIPVLRPAVPSAPEAHTATGTAESPGQVLAGYAATYRPFDGESSVSEPVPAPAPQAPPLRQASGTSPSVSRPQPRAVSASSPALRGLPASFRTGTKAYDGALAMCYRHEYSKARSAFADFIQNNKGHKLLPNAWYWQGESAYSLGDYVDAILSFKNVASQYPKHAKAADALLKTGMSYERLNDRDNALFYWQVLQDDFPKSTAARQARGKMPR